MQVLFSNIFPNLCDWLYFRLNNRIKNFSIIVLNTYQSHDPLNIKL